MVSLPTDVMSRIVKFMDHKSKAKMAQTSRTWRAVIYRSSQWAFWMPRVSNIYRVHHARQISDVYYSKFAIPKRAHHVGEPSRLCFIYWAAQKLMHEITFDIPPEILAIEEAAKCIDMLYLFWLHIRSPCLQIHHHKWSHVCKLRYNIPNTKKDIDYLIARTSEQQESATTNPYRFWLQSYINAFPPISYYTPTSDTSDDIIKILQNREYNNLHKKLRELSYRQEQYILPLTSSLQHLAKLSIHEFDTNELLYKRGLPDACAFSVASS